MEGYPGFLSRAESGGPSGNTLCDIANVLYITSSNVVTGTNDGKSGAVVSYISTKAQNISLTPPPKYLVMEGGINDMSGSGKVFSDEQTYFDAVKTACASHGSTMLVEEVTPAVLTTNANIVAWNTALHTWALSNSITVIAMHDWMADPGDNTKLYYPNYTADHTHFNQAGVQRHADLIYTTLQTLNP